jgi:hypothetical protein
MPLCFFNINFLLHVIITAPMVTYISHLFAQIFSGYSLHFLKQHFYKYLLTISKFI